jgi:glucosamine--fructose-6-phosphate aminotransferase (isomerizing)
MCGIVGYTGSGQRAAAPVLVHALARLEYRGYDSAGLAIETGDGRGIITRKLSGRVAALRELIERLPVPGASGIAHTRWATHGIPNDRNSHPHTDCHGSIAIVHNGIIENAETLRVALEHAGHVFASETDTETLAHLIEDSEGDSLEARVIAALEHVVGTYGLAVICADEPGKIVVARQGSPVLIGVGEREYFVASDASAILEHTRSVVYMNDGDVAVLTPDGYQVTDRTSRVQERSVDALAWDLDAISLGGHAHFMIKEILEQPETVRSTLRGRLMGDGSISRLNGLNLSPADIAAVRRINIVACGTSWHAGLVGRQIIEDLAGIPVHVEYASEYRYRRQPRVSGGIGATLTIAISQSGETADTLEAMRAARAHGSRVIGIVNAVGSTIAREADGGIYLHAGPEIGVASTKAFTSQIAALALLGGHLGTQRGLAPEIARDLVCHLTRLPDLIAETLEVEPEVKAVAEQWADAHHALYLGRGVNFPVALEGALKLKEISYIHAEGYPAAEMKHGPIALIDAQMPVVFVAPHDDVYPKVVSNLHEVRARGGRILAITTQGNGDLTKGGLADYQLRVPKTLPLLSPILTVIPLQLLAYHIAVLRGCDVDRPRNLAKSVTVE